MSRRRIHFFEPGQRFGRLVCTGETRRKGDHRQQVCRCDCGAVKAVDESLLYLGSAKSCGCLKKETSAKARRTHGESGKAAEYRVWKGMRGRCNNPNTRQWENYGGRGITVCERWHSYENFLADMGRRPSPEHSLDRIDNDGPYAPDNCRWATRIEQQNNTTRNHRADILGKTQTLAEWTREMGLPPSMICRRMETGWIPEDAFLTPPVRAGLFAARGEEHTISEWAELTGIPRPTLTWRLAQGMDIEEALNYSKAQQITFQGKTLTVREWVRKTGIRRETIYDRLKNGWPIERVLTKPTPRMKNGVNHD